MLWVWQAELSCSCLRALVTHILYRLTQSGHQCLLSVTHLELCTQMSLPKTLCRWIWHTHTYIYILTPRAVCVSEHDSHTQTHFPVLQCYKPCLLPDWLWHLHPHFHTSCLCSLNMNTDQRTNRRVTTFVTVTLPLFDCSLNFYCGCWRCAVQFSAIIRTDIVSHLQTCWAVIITYVHFVYEYQPLIERMNVPCGGSWAPHGKVCYQLRK